MLRTFLYSFGLFLLVFGGFVLWLIMELSQSAAEASPMRCAPRAAMLEQLADRYGESRRSLGIAANNMVMEIFANPLTQSWTITVTTPQGMTCLLATGLHWEELPPVPTGVEG